MNPFRPMDEFLPAPEGQSEGPADEPPFFPTPVFATSHTTATYQSRSCGAARDMSLSGANIRLQEARGSEDRFARCDHK